MGDKLRILVVDDDQRMAKTLVDICRIKGFEAESANLAENALIMIENNHYDCVLSDIKMPGMNGVDLNRSIKAKQPYLPVVLMTAYSSDCLVREGLENGVIAVLAKPLDLNRLLTFLSYLNRKRVIVIVDDDQDFRLTLGKILRERNFSILENDGNLELAQEILNEVDVILLDFKLGNKDGFEILRNFRSGYPDIPVIVVTGYSEEIVPKMQVNLDLNIYAYLFKPLDVEKLLEVLNQIHHDQNVKILNKR